MILKIRKFVIVYEIRNACEIVLGKPVTWKTEKGMVIELYRNLLEFLSTGERALILVMLGPDIIRGLVSGVCALRVPHGSDSRIRKLGRCPVKWGRRQGIACEVYKRWFGC